MQMNGLNELITVAKYWRRWSNPTLVVLVLNNRDLNQVTWEQRALQGDPMYPVTQTIPDLAYARFAQMLDLHGVRVESPEMLGEAWDDVLAADRPAVLEAVVDPDVPPLPPHITLEQSKHFIEAVLAGDPHRAGMIRQSMRQMLDALVPGR
jgi:pyruvate dehydrogenase (quinone)